ncbi:hypothetical protein [Aliamphritea hakodatensis]|uniref:hypothetical protein n=1 Tax=Aliamphritea hakodatensis TaxID=2895352 RepID=UPI0022FD7ABF|nr:hypothetical protein [Aliamphritea hakodatensis]
MTEKEWLLSLKEESIQFNADKPRWLAICQKLYAANIQITRSIALYFDQQDYLCSITLAGAANSLIREMLREEYQSDPLGCTAAMAAALGSQREGGNKQSIIRAELHPVNWLKHYRHNRNSPPIQKCFDDNEAAFITIENALCSYGAFVDMFAEQLPRNACEKIFVSTQMRDWEKYWKNDTSYFSW